MFTTNNRADDIMFTVANFSEWLLKELNRRGWSQADLAREAGLTRGGVSLLISQNRMPGVETVVGIARAFNLPTDEVLRAAGLQPKKDARTVWIERAEHYLSLMTPEEQERWVRLIEAAAEIEARKRRGNPDESHAAP